MLKFSTYMPAAGLICLLLFCGPAGAQNPPEAPLITEPAADGAIVNPADVHMETAPMADPDGDTHLCTDWQIWSQSPVELVWQGACLGNLEKLHAHLGDGVFLGSLAGMDQLAYESDYILQVRHRDDSGMWSPFSARLFRTGVQTDIFPMELQDVAVFPQPRLSDADGIELLLAGGSSLRLENPAAALFLAFSGTDSLNNPPSLPLHAPVRVVFAAGPAGQIFPPAVIHFTDDEGRDRLVYLPAVNLAPQEQRYFWISINGSSYLGAAGQSEPDFSELAQGAPVPWLNLQPGYQVEVFAQGLQLPVNIAFSPAATAKTHGPYMYVTELYGIIKVVLDDGTVGDYATNLLNFDPLGGFPGSGEQGMAGIVVDPLTGDVYASMLYDAAPPNGPHYPRVVRFQSSDGGLTASSQTTILDMPGESQGQSHFISSLTIGPDGKLYVHMGDGFTASTALDLNSFRGKVLRVNLDGSAPADNPFYDSSNGISATDYIYAYGFRNPFGGVWRAEDQAHYSVENGPDINDRITRVLPGVSYGWDGSGGSLATNALYLWTVPHAPVNMAFIEPTLFNGSMFPAEKMGHAFVTESGPTWASGPQARGKRIVEFVFSPGGTLLAGPITLVEYAGSGKATAVGLAAGPDGLYFTDLYKDTGFQTPIDRGANVLRVRFVGEAAFAADPVFGNAPLTVQFSDLSNVPGASAWKWSFGDGSLSNEQYPLHTYQQNGVYDVRLEVTGSNGLAVKQKQGYIVAGDIAPGLSGDYYDNINFTGAQLTRIDPEVNFDWGSGSPDPAIGPDQFSVRWSGQVEPEFSETYTFYTLVDDGVRLWIDDQLLIDSWIDQGPTEYSGSISLQAGQRYNVLLEYYENGGGAVVRFSWSSPGVPKQIVPSSHLYSGRLLTAVPAAAPVLPSAFSLEQNYPNPFNPATKIVLQLPERARVNLEVFDLHGRRVRTLVDGRIYPPGTPLVEWDGRRDDGRRAASGIYFYRTRISAVGSLNSYTRTRKMILLR